MKTRWSVQEQLGVVRQFINSQRLVILLASNAAVFLANMLFTSRSSAIMNALAVDPSVMEQPWQWYRMLSYGFAHAPKDPMHIVFNMVSLYFLGRNDLEVESPSVSFRVSNVSGCNATRWLLLRKKAMNLKNYRRD